jgi:hypothetical protein
MLKNNLFKLDILRTDPLYTPIVNTLNNKDETKYLVEFFRLFYPWLL